MSAPSIDQHLQVLDEAAGQMDRQVAAAVRTYLDEVREYLAELAPQLF